MPHEDHFEREFERALRLMEVGQHADALSIISPLLGQEPEWADGHALMAYLLLNLKQGAAAEREAGYAVALDPDSPYTQRAAATVNMFLQRGESAEVAISRAIELDPEDYDLLLTQAWIRRNVGRHDSILPLLERARELAPSEPDVLAAWAEYVMEQGALEEAEAHALAGLAEDSEHIGSMVVLGSIYLRQGRVEEAQGVMRDALAIDPLDESVLGLLAEVKQKQNPLMGLWWRYCVWVEGKGDSSQLAILLGGILFSQLAVLISEDLGYPELSKLLGRLWLLFCGYTWVAPAIFARMMEREIGDVELDEEY